MCAGLLAEAPLDGAAAAFERAAALVGEPRLARQAASGLYHAVSAAALAWEAARLRDPARHAASELVLQHRASPRDPLAAEPDTDDLGRLLGTASAPSPATAESKAARAV